MLRAGGRELGWGFQLQSPGFVAVLASLMFFLALSLAGQFEIGLSLTSAGGGLAQKQGYTGSFFTGVLATVVATPCTAPLMGAAVGFALAHSAWMTFVVFTALALGLAASLSRPQHAAAVDQAFSPNPAPGWRPSSSSPPFRSSPPRSGSPGSTRISTPATASTA